MGGHVWTWSMDLSLFCGGAFGGYCRVDDHLSTSQMFSNGGVWVYHRRLLSLRKAEVLLELLGHAPWMKFVFLCLSSCRDDAWTMDGFAFSSGVFVLQPT